MGEEQLALEAIEGRLENEDYLPQSHWAEEDITALLQEVKRLREERTRIIAIIRDRANSYKVYKPYENWDAFESELNQLIEIIEEGE